MGASLTNPTTKEPSSSDRESRNNCAFLCPFSINMKHGRKIFSAESRIFCFFTHATSHTRDRSRLFTASVHRVPLVTFLFRLDMRAKQSWRRRSSTRTLVVRFVYIHTYIGSSMQCSVHPKTELGRNENGQAKLFLSTFFPQPAQRWSRAWGS